MSSSAIVDMEAAAGSDMSDYEQDFENGMGQSPSLDSKRHGNVKKSSARSKDMPSDEEDEEEGARRGGIKGEISKGVANLVWEESRQRARKAFSLYANIDVLRPYYDVEPHEVRSRLVMSLVPKLRSEGGRQATIPRELYGPTMLVFTLIAMLLFEMKNSGHVIREGTLMGTAFGTCFGYWFGVSLVIWLTTYIFNTRIAMLQILHLLGYALFGHCVVLLLTTVFHPHHSHMFFYLAWIVFGGLSTLRVVAVLMSRTPGKSGKLVIAGIVVVLHLVFLLYLHFAYHQVVQDMSGAHAPVLIPDRAVENQDEVAFNDRPDDSPILGAVGGGGVGGKGGDEGGGGGQDDVANNIRVATEAVAKFARRTLKPGLLQPVTMPAGQLNDPINRVVVLPGGLNKNETFVNQPLAHQE